MTGEGVEEKTSSGQPARKSGNEDEIIKRGQGESVKCFTTRGDMNEVDVQCRVTIHRRGRPPKKRGERGDMEVVGD